jgi:hypothetical protein
LSAKIMKLYYRFLSAALAGLMTISFASAQPPTPAAPLPDQSEPGIIVQTKGPVHEAYAQPGDVKPEPGAIVARRPPDPIPEEPPEQKPEGDNVQWIPGYWAYDSDRSDFLWVSGFWRVPPPGRRWVSGHWAEARGGWQWVAGFWAAENQEQVPYVADVPDSLDNGPSVPAPSDDSLYVPGVWVPRDERFLWRPGYWMNPQQDLVWNNACYSWTPNGYLFNDGYWDYPLADRGLLFAPVCFNQPFWNTPGWCYRPHYCLNWGGVLASLFVRPGCGHYYFGNYYGTHYGSLGFRPWYAYGARSHDSLYGYYNWAHRGDRGWYAGLHSAYFGPNRLRTVTPLNQWRGQGHHLAATTSADLAHQRVTAQRSQALANERSRLETSRHAAALRLPADGNRHGEPLPTIQNGRSFYQGPPVAHAYSGTQNLGHLEYRGNALSQRHMGLESSAPRYVTPRQPYVPNYRHVENVHTPAPNHVTPRQSYVPNYRHLENAHTAAPNFNRSHHPANNTAPRAAYSRPATSSHSSSAGHSSGGGHPSNSHHR